jgi:hypothetical protein
MLRSRAEQLSLGATGSMKDRGDQYTDDASVLDAMRRSKINETELYPSLLQVARSRRLGFHSGRQG